MRRRRGVRRYQVVGAAAVEAATAQHDGVHAAAMVLVHHARHDALGHADASHDRTALVVQLHDVARLKAQHAGVGGMHPQGLVLVAVGAGHLHVLLHLAEPRDVVQVRMHAPPRMVRHQEERVRAAALQVLALLMPGAFVHPVRDGAALLVVGEHLRERRGVVFQLARRRLKRMALGVVMELRQAHRQVFPVLLRGERVVLLLLELLEGHLLRGARVFEAGLDVLLAGLAAHVALVEVLVDAAELLQRLGDLAHGLHVGLGLQSRLDGLALVVHQVPLAVVGVGADVFRLELRVRGQDDVGEVAVVLHPGVLHDDALDGGMAQRLLHLVAAVPARLPARRVRPDHVQALVALQRERERPGELVLAREPGTDVAVPGHRRVHDGFGDHGLGDEALREAAEPAAVGGAAVGDLGGWRQRCHRLHAVERPFDELELVRARLAHALHAQKRHFQARRLVRVAGPDEGAAVAVRDGHGVLGPVARERLDGVAGDAADGLGPLGGLRHAVLAAHDVVLEVLEADRVGVQVLLVVGAFLDPRVGDGQLQRGVGIGLDGNPQVRMHGVRVVHVGRDVDLLDAQLGEPEAQPACQVAAPSQGGRLHVATPEQHRVAVLGDVLDDVVLQRVLPERVHAPDVLGAPVPAFPAVGLARLQRVGADEVEHAALAAVRRMDELRLAMAVELAQDGGRAVRVMHALDLFRDEVARLVPRDAHIAAGAARLRMALAVRVPVLAAHRVGDAVLGVHALLVGERQRRDQRLEAGLERLSARLDLPGVHLLGGVVLVEVQRADAQDLVLLLVDVHRAGVAAQAEAVEAQALDDGRPFHVVPHAFSSLGAFLAVPCPPPRARQGGGHGDDA